jgi:branched-chain amino acid aminotransferase
MNECFGKKFIINGVLNTAELFDNSMVYEGDSIYEVIRVVKGCPLFFHDHMERLVSSVKSQNKMHLADTETIIRAIINLVKSDKKKETNIKIVFNYKETSQNYLVYFIESVFPSEEQYKKGVKGILFFAERKDPEAKVINHKLRSSIYHRLIQDAGYEAILVNENNRITEGSRSNIFFLKGETLTTAPDKVVLNGITRKNILDICREKGIDVRFECVKVDKISEFDSVFMTGTSPKVLPFYCIEDKLFNVKSPLIEKIRNLYMLKAEESIRIFKSVL